MTKRIMLLLLVLTSYMNARATDERTFILDGKTWTCNQTYENTSANMAYDVPRMTYTISGQDVTDAARNSLGTLREADRKVYFTPKGEDTEYLLYDFSLQPGERAVVGYGKHRHQVEVIAADDITVDGTTLRRMKMAEVMDGRRGSIEGWWVEGIGSNLGPLRPGGWTTDGAAELQRVDIPQRQATPFKASDFDRGTSDDHRQMLSGCPYWEYQIVTGIDDVRSHGNDRSFFKIVSLYFYTVGKMVKNGKVYQRLVWYAVNARWDGEDGDPNEGMLAFPSVIPVREEGGRVYVDREAYSDFITGKTGYPHPIATADRLPYEETGDGELVLYDFSRPAGYQFQPTTVTVAEATDKGLTLSNGALLTPGLGCQKEGMLLDYLNLDGQLKWWGVTAFSHDGEYLIKNWYGWRHDDQLSAIRPTQAATATPAAPLFDLSGRQLQGAPQRKGVYISGGKKVVR